MQQSTMSHYLIYIDKATLMVCWQHVPATKIQFTNLTTTINTVAT